MASRPQLAGERRRIREDRTAELLAQFYERLAVRVSRLEEDKRIFQEKLYSIEHRKTIEYRGVWQSDTLYERGDFCTHAGSLFAAKQSSCGVVPGGSPLWQLAAKKGRDCRR